ncbi:hypothetical protein ACLMAJ_16945 [Nocardia sp. KC 131]|uniref:hypothetical protein n=1 Tax=Nocardia arseniciresistens TaxID=3392119 RepID=UPI00398F1822
MTGHNPQQRATKTLLGLLIVSATVVTPAVLMPAQVLAQPGPTASTVRAESPSHHGRDKSGSDSSRQRRRNDENRERRRNDNNHRRQNCGAQFIPGPLFCGLFTN